MQVGIDVTCMHTNFGGCGLSGFGDITTFKNNQFSLSDHGQPIFHFGPWTVHGLKGKMVVFESSNIGKGGRGERLEEINSLS